MTRNMDTFLAYEMRKGNLKDCTAIHFIGGTFPEFVGSLRCVSKDTLQDGSVAVIMPGRVTHADVKAIILDSYAVYRGNVPTRWGLSYIHEA